MDNVTRECIRVLARRDALHTAELQLADEQRAVAILEAMGCDETYSDMLYARREVVRLTALIARLKEVR